MRVNFRKIILEDTFAYKYLEFDFTSGIYSIGGNNGASKTSIYLALAQCLFNKNPKGTKVDDVSNYITKQPYQITVYFTKGEDAYKVVNSKKTGTITVVKNSKDISKNTIPKNLELIREIIYDNYETFVDRTYQSTDSTLDLVEDSTDTARKNFVNKVLRFDELDSMLADVKAKLKQVKSEAKSKDEAFNTLKGSLVPFKVEADEVDESPYELAVDKALGRFNTAQETYNKVCMEGAALKEKRKANAKYLEAKAKETKLTNQLSNIKLACRLEESKKRLDEWLKLEHTYGAALDKTTEECNSLKAPELTCSKCGQTVAHKDAVRIYLDEEERLTKEMHKLTHQYGEAVAKVRQLREEVGNAQLKQSIEKELEQIKSLTFNAEPVSEEDIADHEEKEFKWETDRDFLADLLNRSREELAAVKQDNVRRRTIKKVNAEIAENNKRTSAMMEQLLAEISELKKRQDLLEDWERILGSKGYRVSKMTSFLDLLNSTMDKYSEVISGGKIKCRFFVTSDGKIEFSVVDPDKLLPFANWSNGERARVKLACLFSVIEILELKGSSSYNILVLDEIFSALDEEGKEGLFDILSYLRNNGKCVYTISHTPLVNKVVFDGHIEVVKESGLASLIL